MFNSNLIQVSFIIGSNKFGIQCKPNFNLIPSNFKFIAIQFRFNSNILFFSNLVLDFMKLSFASRELVLLERERFFMQFFQHGSICFLT